MLLNKPLLLGLAAAAAAVAAEEAPPPAPGGACGFTTEPVEKDIGQGFRTWVWTEPYREELFADGLLLDDAAFEEYTKWLNKTIPRDFGGLDPFNQTACLIHQRGIFAGAGFGTHDWDVILNGSVGAISAANCLESALWAKQNEYHPQKLSATEFGAYILLDSANTTVKVYLQTGPELGVPGMEWVDKPIAADLAAGFKLATFLHLHPFDASNTKYQDCAGTCIPSGPDLHAFASDLKEFSAESAWITNGQDSFRFPLTELGMFNGDNDGSALGQQVARPEIYRGEQA